MKKNKQTRICIAVFAFSAAVSFLLAGTNNSSAQQEPPKNTVSGMVLANVNMRDAKIEKQEKNILTISFNISNDFDKIQPGILLRASLQKKENNLLTVVDEKIIGGEFTLEANEKSHREITYAVPDFMQGQYEIWLNARTAGGFPLATARAGETTFSGTNDYIEIINSSCFLKVKGESDDKKYTLLQGVDIEKNENLQAVCDLMNHSDQPKNFSVQFQTFQRNTFGKLLEANAKSDPAFTLVSKQKKQFIFDLPKAKDPQAYDIKLTLQENKKNISNSAVFHYVLRGASATIQSLQMDKVSYQKDEKAKVSLLITGPADSFPGTRHGAGTDLKGASLSVKIQSGQTICGQTQKNPRLDGMTDSFDIAIAENCPEPAVSATLKDSAGNILAEKNFFVGKNSQVEMEKAAQLEADRKSGKSSMAVLIIVVILLIILLGAYALWKYKKKSSIIFPILFLGLSLVISLHMTRPAEALTLGYIDPEMLSPYAEGYIDKSVYSPGESISIWGFSTIIPPCSNSGGPGSPFPFTAQVNGSTYTLSGGGSATGTAESLPGNYSASFTLTGWYGDGTSPPSSYSGYIPYTVIDPAVNGSCGWANGSSSCTPPSGGLCSVGSPSGVSDLGYWSWSCSGYYGGSTASCSASKSVINASCGWAMGDITNPFQPTDGFCGPGHLVGGLTDNDTSWSWTCASDCNGAPASCTKPKPIIDGECKNGQTFCPGASLSDAELCVKGYPSIDVAPDAFSNTFSWQCLGYNGGNNTSVDACSASTYSHVKTSIVSNVCQNVNISTSPPKPASDFCYDGKPSYTASITQDPFTYKWTCEDSCGTLEASPEYDKKAPTNGVCGAADGKNLCDGLGSLNWCEEGTPIPNSPDPDGYDVSWRCVDPSSCGGTSDNCSAMGRKSCGWIEANP